MDKGYGTGEGSIALHRYHTPPIKPPPPPPLVSHFSHPIPSSLHSPFSFSRFHLAVYKIVVLIFPYHQFPKIYRIDVFFPIM
jgi:hypothetical protein